MAGAADFPAPYFGGKGHIADYVWSVIGAEVPHYAEPFGGSGAVLLKRPGGAPKGGRTEVLGDADWRIVNVHRSLRSCPEAVAAVADHPPCEGELRSRWRWLMESGECAAIADSMHGDVHYCHPEAAGWWLWIASVGLGSVWNRGGAPPIRTSRSLTGVRALGRRGQLPEVFAALSRRLADVLIVCGDWTRCLPNATPSGVGSHHAAVAGVFLDPPYGDGAGRDPKLYALECPNVAAKAREWAIEHGDDHRYRIVLCGLAGEHDMPRGWREHRWKTSGGGYGNLGDGRNRKRECLWISPHCLKPGGLFDGLGDDDA